jgi:putative restriction endonuclease
MCGFDGALGHYPVAIEAAHVRWHSQHALFDLGVLGITEACRICVSRLYVARTEAGRAVDALADKSLLIPRPHQARVDVVYISWHRQQVFKGTIEI